MEKWKNGKMEKWKNGKMEKWKLFCVNDNSTKVRTVFNSTVLRNSLLDSILCKRAGECNEFHHNMDCTILQSCFNRNQGIPIVKELVDLDLLYSRYDGQKLAWSGRPCVCSGEECGKCIRIDLSENKLIKSPLIYLKESYRLSRSCRPTFSRPQAIDSWTVASAQ
jgi:hypothetical protein